MKQVLCWAMLVYALMPSNANGCSMVLVETQVSPTFRVKVEDRGHPVAGLPLKMKGYPTVLTDSRGFAFFRNVPLGSHLIYTAEDSEFGGVHIKVKARGPINVTIPLAWPSVDPLATRSLKGTIQGSDFRGGFGQDEFTLHLLDARSRRELKKLDTNNRGEFDFEMTTPGMYILKFNLGEIPVSIEPNARAQELAAGLVVTSCGLMFSDLSDCRRGELLTDRVAGMVIDPAVGGVSRADVVVFDDTGTTVERLPVDSEGRFFSGRLLSGVYSVAVESPGFTPYRGRVRVDPNLPPSEDNRLTIRLGFAGSCAVAPR